MRKLDLISLYESYMKSIVFISFLFCVIVCWGTDYNVIIIMFFGIIVINALEIAEKALASLGLFRLFRGR